MKEISGIEISEGNPLIYMINDSRNAPEVYGYDISKGKLTQTIRLKNATNIDWEDLATGPDGALYVGDFGNNASNREDLTIYHLPPPNALEKRRYEPEATVFQYEDQKKFPPKDKDQSFDAEAFIVLNDHFYIFGRNRAKRFNGKAKIYKVPIAIGTQTAKLIGSFETCNDEDDCQLTAAAINHKNGDIVLLSYNKLWHLSGYAGDDFNSGRIVKYNLGHTSQKESICFKDDQWVYIADEGRGPHGLNLYEFELNFDE